MNLFLNLLISFVVLFCHFHTFNKYMHNLIISSKWGSDSYAKGSYTFINTGSTVDDIIALAEPLVILKSIKRSKFVLKKRD